jgi:tetratricopeptide (TPR) repeat protein
VTGGEILGEDPLALPDGSPSDAPLWRVGSELAGYRLEAAIAEGGMAWVFRARHRGLDRLVALKILKPVLAADREYQRRFVAEARAASAVDDPHIIPVYEAGEADGVLFIAMRLITGGDLSGLAEREGPLSASRAAGFISPVASALDAAHGAGLVHRDVKPANILVDMRPGRPDHVYLSDFGVSKGAMSAPGLTEPGVFVGTPGYSAPEQFEGRPVDGRTDQYALACVAYQLLTGDAPFSRDSFLSVMTAHLSGPPPSLEARRPDLPIRADRVLARALAKDPGDRFGSCGDFADALRQALGLAPYDARTSAGAPALRTTAGAAALAATVTIAPPPAVTHPPTAAAQSDAVARGRAGNRAGDRAGAGGSAMAARTLPRDIASFTGRKQELQNLADAAGSGGVVGIHAIGGMAGIGKTAFAVHAAHQLATRFPAGQIFLPLHGHTPGQQPLSAGDALASLLLTIGVPAAEIPPGVEARIALWRDRTAARQLLLVLDDAASSEQVRPLLPGAGASLVLVTSRRHLSALEDLTAISLDTLPSDEAAALLVRLAGRSELSADDPAVGEVTRLCGYLPLAIGMLARQLHHHPAWSLIGRAADLMAARDRLELMETENLSVAAAFDLSYQDLSPDQQRLFRRLGLHPGTDIDAYAAAALYGTGLAAARRALEALYDHYLLTEPAQGRYRLHDLLREHARALAGRHDTSDDRERATDRLLDYYQHTAAIADDQLAAHRRPARAYPASAEPAAAPVLADRTQALAWARAERANLLACLDHATETGQDARVIALTYGLTNLLFIDGPWTETMNRHLMAVRAAQHLGDRPAEASALDDLGWVRLLTTEHASAEQPVQEALGIYRELGDRYGEAFVLSNLGTMRLSTGDYPGAAGALTESLNIRREIGDRVGQAWALSNLGDVRRMIGDYPGAIEAQEQAFGIFRDMGDRYRQAAPLFDLGIVRLVIGDHTGAAQALEESLNIRRDFGDREGQADVLCNLGEVRRLVGDYQGAIQALEEGLEIYLDTDRRRGEANARGLLGVLYRLTGDYQGAARSLGEALRIYRDIGDRGGEATMLNESGTLHRVCGDLGQAAFCHQEALDLAREIGSPWDEAHALAGLGRVALAADRAADAETQLRQALEIFRRIGTAEAADLAIELDAIRTAAEDPGSG